MSTKEMLETLSNQPIEDELECDDSERQNENLQEAGKRQKRKTTRGRKRKSDGDGTRKWWITF